MIYFHWVRFQPGEITRSHAQIGGVLKSCLNKFYPVPSGVIKHGWKIPELNGGFNLKIAYKWSFSIAVFDFWRVGK